MCHYDAKRLCAQKLHAIHIEKVREMEMVEYSRCLSDFKTPFAIKCNISERYECSTIDIIDMPLTNMKKGERMAL